MTTIRTAPGEKERAAIVAWLRDPGTVMSLSQEYVERRKDGQPTAATQQNRGVAYMYFMDAADAIARGAHLLVPGMREEEG